MSPHSPKAAEWLGQNWGNVLAGIVASLIVLALQVVTRALALVLATLVTLDRTDLLYQVEC